MIHHYLDVGACTCMYYMPVRITGPDPTENLSEQGKNQRQATVYFSFFFFSLQNILSMLEDHDSDASSTSPDSDSISDIEDEDKEDEYEKLDNDALQEAFR